MCLRPDPWSYRTQGGCQSCDGTNFQVRADAGKKDSKALKTIKNRKFLKEDSLWKEEEARLTFGRFLWNQRSTAFLKKWGYMLVQNLGSSSDEIQNCFPYQKAETEERADPSRLVGDRFKAKELIYEPCLRWWKDKQISTSALHKKVRP